MVIASGKVTSTWGKETPVMTTREELNKDAARAEWKKLIAQDQKRTKENWTKTESQGF